MTREKTNITNIGFQSIFESAPDLYLLLSPCLEIIGSSDAYIKATLTKREEIMGRDLFEVFPDNPDDHAADGVSNLRASLNTVLQSKAPHKMALQKYDIRRPDGTFEERFWRPLNTPVLNTQGEVIYIIHRVEDVTEEERIKKDMAKYLKRNEELEAVEKNYVANLKASEDRFIKIFNFSPISIFITDDAEGRIMYVNNAFEKLFLFARKQVVGKTVVEIGITDDANRALAIQKIKQMGGNSVIQELELKNAKGEIKHILSSSEMIEVDNKKCYMTAMIDITPRKKMEIALHQANHFLDTILEHIPDMIFVKDARDFTFLRINKAGEQLLGRSRKEFVGKSNYDFLEKEYADTLAEQDRQALRNKDGVTIEELKINTPDGEKWLHTQKIPVYENNEPVYLVGISEDITEKKKQQDAIMQLNKELEAFSYSVSHDLRSPLRAVTGFAKILEEDYSNVLDEEGKRLLNTISSNAEKMGHLIDDLLNFSRLGRKDVVLMDTDMNELVRSAIRDVSRSMDHSAQINTGTLHLIKSDSALMMQVLVNLISNAIKYSSKKQSPRIEIHSEEAGNEVIFSIKDNGAGFDMRYVSKLFGVFQRLHTTDEFEGTGVGLAIVQRIISKHEGKVWAEGKLNEGATIYFSLPKK